MFPWKTGFIASLVLLSSVAVAQTAAPINFMPGVNQVVFPPFTPEESERAIRSRRMPANLIRSLPTLPSLAGARQAARNAAPVGPASIAELARALKNDVDLIYEYVRNNAEYYPIWGVQKGPVGTILDNQGTSFDQASLMVALLRQAGYTASYIKGGINLTAAQYQGWLNIKTSDTCGVLQLFTNGQIPYSSVVGATSCSGPVVPLVSMTIYHVWVKVNIGGTDYYFDPSFKPHTIKTGINLATASGYNAATYLTQARSGATITGDYIQAANRANIRNNLGSYATTLANYLRTNLPAAALDDVIGGMAITPYTGGNLRQTSLPYQDSSVPVEEWTGEIDAMYKPLLQVDYYNDPLQPPILSTSFTSDLIYGSA